MENDGAVGQAAARGVAKADPEDPDVAR